VIAAALGIAVAACAGGTPDRITTVAIAATPCDRPAARLGVGTVVAEGLVLTAAHVVEDDLRNVEVDGHPARVVALDARTDSAVLALEAPIDYGAATTSDANVADAVRIVTPTDVVATTVRRIVTLSVNDTTNRVVYHRRALVLDGTVPAGTSGAPVVDARGRIVAMVNISHTGRDVTYATAATEIQSLLGSELPDEPAVTQSSLAAPGACA
jgi:hypothetical protein